MICYMSRVADEHAELLSKRDLQQEEIDKLCVTLGTKTVDELLIELPRSLGNQLNELLEEYAEQLLNREEMP